jgi:hypothetical protein
LATPLFAQKTKFQVDTLLTSVQYEILFLKHHFIIDSTFFLFQNSSLVDSFSLNPIDGELIVTKSLSHPTKLIASYRYLDEHIPNQVGPLLNTYPEIDSLLRRTATLNLDPIKIPIKHTTNVKTSGTFYRGINVNPIGNANFSGGIKLSLDGNLSENMTISGVLTDQNLPYQSGNATQTISELDQVYIHINHPKFSILAGDILMKKKQGTLLKINKNLIGLNGNFESDKWKGNIFFGGLKGKYHSFLISESDRNQGPYFLMSNTGNRNIVIIAGSETVWLNGEKLTKGRDKDYSIDYNRGEIRFTPNRIIQFDSEIFIEYEYSDFQYSRDIMASNFHYKPSKNKNVSISWMQEKDRFDNSLVGLTNENLDSLAKLGDQEFSFSSAELDSLGTYYLENGIYYYSQQLSEIESYSVRFYYDPQGNYAQKIDSNGSIYYEFVESNIKSDWNDYYSPEKRVTKPVLKNYYHFNGNYPILNQGYTKIEMAISQVDLNTKSSKNDDDNLGHAYQMSLGWDNLPIYSSLKLDVNTKHWMQSDKYHSIESNRDADFYTNWNEKKMTSGLEKISEGRAILKFQNLGNVNTSVGEYSNQHGTKRQIHSKSDLSFYHVPELTINLIQTRSNHRDFQKYSTKFLFLPGDIHPLFESLHELSEENYSLNELSGGILWKSKHGELKLIHSEREEVRMKEGIKGTSQINKFKWKQLKDSGWYHHLMLVNRQIKTDSGTPDNQFSMGDLRIGFKNKSSLIGCDGIIRFEESLTESKSVVYDSVGVGFGDYRYDLEYDSYFADPNGSYISFTVPTGVRIPTTHFNSSYKWNILFPKTSNLFFKYGKIHIFSQRNFQGKGLGIKKLMNFNLEDFNVRWMKWILKSEYLFRIPSQKKIARITYFLNKNLNGLEELKRQVSDNRSIGFEWKNPIATQTVFVHNSIIRTHATETKNNSLQNRSAKSYWSENGVSYSVNSNTNVLTTLNLGKSNGMHENINYSSEAIGIKSKTITFIRKINRVEFSLDWNHIQISDPSITLAPEIFNGLSGGTSLRLGGNIRISIGDNMYLKIDMQFIDNNRSKNWVNLHAEIRSQF